MALTLSWPELVGRLLLAALAGGLFGFDRSEHGHPAGLRTTMLVCLAAAVVMIQMNLMLPIGGRQSDSFIMNDLMRLPLGVLSGIGFIGAGVILRRGGRITGLTTAATLWLVTMVGLALGSGLYGLGGAATAVGMAILWGLKAVERHLRVMRKASLAVTLDLDSVPVDEVRRKIEGSELSIKRFATSYDLPQRRCILSCDLCWSAPATKTDEPAIVGALQTTPGILALAWRPIPANQ